MSQNPHDAVPRRRRTLAVVGYGMVGHKLVQGLVERGATQDWDVVVLGEEPWRAYDRVHLSSMFEGATADDLALDDLALDDPALDDPALDDPALHDPALDDSALDDPALDDLALDDAVACPGDAVVIHLDDRATSIDRAERVITTAAGRSVRYDTAVLATGSVPFVPPVPGWDRPGCFVYRTIDDVQAIQAWAEHCRRAVVVGGGLLGLEAAHALHSWGLSTHVVEVAPRLMPVQVDDVGGAVLRQRIEALGVVVHTSTALAAIEGGEGGAVGAVLLGAPGSSGPGDGSGRRIDADMVVFSAGVRPRDDLARASGLLVGERGGVVVDRQCRTSDPSIYAIGECALADGRVYGLVSPGFQMARVVADTVCGTPAAFDGADLSTKLKLMGVDVASFGDAHATSCGAKTVAYTDLPRLVHKRLVVGPGGAVVGGVLVGDASAYGVLSQMARGDIPSPEEPGALLSPALPASEAVVGMDALAPTALVCSCENVSKGSICAAVTERVAVAGSADVRAVKAATRAGTGCGGCVPQISELVRSELARAGVAVDDRLCEHFPYARQQLFDIVRVEGITSFAVLLARRGQGRGCEICRPVVASILASLGNGYILDPEQSALQDTNDHVLAHLQRDGTYSVVPRVPGGEITPERLVCLGEVAREFSLYVKITGGQRIDLLGARLEHLPAIWGRLVDAGFESGHAYGKALRTVKSCVGTAWCRYGVQDSTALAIDLELRYRGLRAPHKIKMAVSGCARECAEAQSKDVGVIASERGWNLYVGGNGGTRPRHGDLLAEDLSTDDLVRTIDRFLMFYIRTADRLQRTASWLERLPGGLGYLRSVIVDDAIGVCSELDDAMARHVDSYQCEWRATLEDPDRLRRFRTFLNSEAPDPDIVMVTERDQPRPARPGERVALAGSRA